MSSAPPSLTQGWVATIPLSKIDDEYPEMAIVNGVEVVLCRVGEQVFALGNICSHAFARLSDGYVKDGQVFCSLHMGSFDLCTGKAVAEPCLEPVERYPTRIEDGIVLVAVTPSGV